MKPARILLALWVGINLVQAAITGLAYDEAYYWMWSNFPAWGYYEHPPMVAFLIRIGYALIRSELGVRIAFVALSAGAIALAFRLAGQRSAGIFFTMIFSSFYFHVTGAAAVPGVPLVFFTVLFFIILKEYFSNERVWPLLAAVIALTVYSKYQGILTVLFVVIANPSLLKRKSFYWIAGVTAVLLLPHVWWEFSHDFPTVRLHLAERFREPYTPLFILRYVVGQPLILGPLTGIVILGAALLRRPADEFERTLKVTLVGFLVFFLLFSLRGKMEPNWTAPAFIPALLLAHRFLADHSAWRKWLYGLAVPSFALILLARIQIVYPVVHLTDDFGAQFRGWGEFSRKVDSLAGDRPVVAHSYAIASKLSFYGRRMVPSLNADSLSNQYEYWHLADSLAGKEVLFLSPRGTGDVLWTPAGKALYPTLISSFSREEARLHLLGGGDP